MTNPIQWHISAVQEYNIAKQTSNRLQQGKTYIRASITAIAAKAFVTGKFVSEAGSSIVQTIGIGAARIITRDKISSLIDHYENIPKLKKIFKAYKENLNLIKDISAAIGFSKSENPLEPQEDKSTKTEAPLKNNSPNEEPVENSPNKEDLSKNNQIPQNLHGWYKFSKNFKQEDDLKPDYNIIFEKLNAIDENILSTKDFTSSDTHKTQLEFKIPDLRNYTLENNKSFASSNQSKSEKEKTSENVSQSKSKSQNSNSYAQSTDTIKRELGKKVKNWKKKPIHLVDTLPTHRIETNETHPYFATKKEETFKYVSSTKILPQITLTEENLPILTISGNEEQRINYTPAPTPPTSETPTTTQAPSPAATPISTRPMTPSERKMKREKNSDPNSTTTNTTPTKKNIRSKRNKITFLEVGIHPHHS